MLRKPVLGWATIATSAVPPAELAMVSTRRVRAYWGGPRRRSRFRSKFEDFKSDPQKWQALLCDELKKAKEDKDNAKKAAKQAAKVEKNCLKRRARLLKARHGSFRSGGLLSPNIPPNNGPLHTPQVTSSCFASECSVVPQAAKGLSKEDIQLLLTAKEADNTGD